MIGSFSSALEVGLASTCFCLFGSAVVIELCGAEDVGFLLEFFSCTRLCVGLLLCSFCPGEDFGFDAPLSPGALVAGVLE